MKAYKDFIVSPIGERYNNSTKVDDKELIDLGNGRKLKAIYGPGHAKHHYTFYDEYSKTLFMGDTLGLIYPHGDFVQPNLPPPDFNKEVLFSTLDDLYKLAKEENNKISKMKFLRILKN